MQNNKNTQLIAKNPQTSSDNKKTRRMGESGDAIHSMLHANVFGMLRDHNCCRYKQGNDLGGVSNM